MKPLWNCLGLAAAIVLTSFAGQLAQAQETLRTTTMSTLLRSITKNDTVNPGALANVFTPVPSSTTTVNCPATQTRCTIEVIVGVQVTGPSLDNNTFAACPRINGVLVDRCPIFGKQPNFLSTETRTWSFYVGNVRPGRHTVVLQFFSQPGTMTVREYTMKTSIYAP